MEIRKVGLNEIKALQAIGEHSYTPHYTHLWKPGGVEWYMRRCFADAVLETELADENIEYYIVTSESADIGILKVVLQKPVHDSEIENALYLEKIYFVKEWTGKGVGRKFIQFDFERARELSRDCVWLMAMDTSDKPVAAYQRAGFQIHSRTRLDFEIMKEEFRGMVVMTNCFNND